jgi:hypothetical protein
MAGFSLGASAQIYKWKDKDGTIRYTDTPPPPGIKSMTTLGKKQSGTTTESVPAAATSAPAQGVTDAVASPVTEKAEDVNPEALAKKRREIEEVEKRNKAEKETQAKQKQLNCAAARSNYQSYSQGGRVYRTNENGEREYLSDDQLQASAAKAQQEVQQYCN